MTEPSNKLADLDATVSAGKEGFGKNKERLKFKSFDNSIAPDLNQMKAEFKPLVRLPKKELKIALDPYAQWRANELRRIEKGHQHVEKCEFGQLRSIE